MLLPYFITLHTTEYGQNHITWERHKRKKREWRNSVQGMILWSFTRRWIRDDWHNGAEKREMKHIGQVASTLAIIILQSQKGRHKKWKGSELESHGMQKSREISVCVCSLKT